MLIMRSFGGDIGKDRNWGIKNIHNTKFYSEKIEARFVLPNTKYSQHKSFFIGLDRFPYNYNIITQ